MTTWRRVRDGFWFVPGAVVAAHIGLALLLVRIDRGAGDGGLGVGFAGDAEAARGILSTIAGSLITVAGLAFSLTIVVLVLVSSQFSPRSLPEFLGDRVNQVTAGAFIGIFAYCLVVLRTLRADDGGAPGFVPSLSVTVAIGFALVALALLLLFIHHMGVSIQASHLVARITRRTRVSFERLDLEPYGAAEADGRDAVVRRWRATGPPGPVAGARPGYVDAIDRAGIAACLAGPDVRIDIAVCPGDFVTQATVLVSVWPAGLLDARRCDAVRRCIAVQNERDLRDDAMYGVRQLADIAVKALSPGINDPTTATTCVGSLTALLEYLATRAVPSDVHRLSDGSTLVAATRPFAEYIDTAFAEIGRYARDNARVVVALLEALEAIAVAARSVAAHDRMGLIAARARDLAGPAIEDARTDFDRRLVQDALAHVAAACR